MIVLEKDDIRGVTGPCEVACCCQIFFWQCSAKGEFMTRYCSMEDITNRTVYDVPVYVNKSSAVLANPQSVT